MFGPWIVPVPSAPWQLAQWSSYRNCPALTMSALATESGIGRRAGAGRSGDRPAP